MSIAITEDHVALAQTVADFLVKHDARGVARSLLVDEEAVPAFAADAAALGWLGLHVPEQYGGSGYGIEEAVVVAEQLGRALAPGAFVPSMIAAGVIAATGSDELKARLLPGLADGSVIAGVATNSLMEQRDGRVYGNAPLVVGAGLADVLVLPVGGDAIVVTNAGEGVRITVPTNIDPTRRSGKVEVSDTPGDVLPGGGRVLLDLARTLFGAEAVGVARACTDMAAAYARERIQFGRPIAMFQAVKHHCANMAVATELATAAVWDAARAAGTGGDQFSFTAAMAATLAGPAADLCANLNTQVHGGIGFTWEHDAHLYLRRATALAAILDPEHASVAVSDLVRDGVRRSRSVDLPPEAEVVREQVRAFLDTIGPLDADARRDRMIEAGYAVPHWPRPYGRDAAAVEQLVIEQEFEAAGIARPQYGITGWVILTLIQYATDDQIARWVRPALRQDVIWCQLFSEPDAGSDAAGITTRATRVDGGWLVNGQKVWTSGAHRARWGSRRPAPTPTCPSTRASRRWSSTWRDPASRSGRSRCRRATRSSTRCSSTTCSSPTTTSSVRSTVVGRSLAPRSATRA